MESCYSSDRKSPPPDGAFQVSSCRQSNGLQMEDAVCVLSQGHSTRPLLRHSFSASLEASLRLFFYHLTSQAVRQMAATATQKATVHLHAWREPVLEHCMFLYSFFLPQELIDQIKMKRHWHQCSFLYVRVVSVWVMIICFWWGSVQCSVFILMRTIGFCLTLFSYNKSGSQFWSGTQVPAWFHQSCL